MALAQGLTGFTERMRDLATGDQVRDVASTLFLFLLILLLSWLFGRAARTTYQNMRRQAPTSGQLLAGKMLHITAVVVGTGIALWAVYGVDPLGILAALGLVSIALGFGLQNTVANLAAGFSLAMDKPFDVGDRIRVGETWGDVQSIGLRSLRIRTVNGETVVIPNSLMDTQELWNYTKQGDLRYRLDIPIGISYDSSIELAEHLMLLVTKETDEVLAYPEPVVRMRGFGESSMDLELRVWLRDAHARPAVRDRLLRGIKRAFAREGVLFPFPQRTVSVLSELPKPAGTPEFLQEGHAAKPVVLACIRDRPPANAVERVVQFTAALDARLVVLNVRSPRRAMEETQAQHAANRYLEEAQRRGVAARVRLAVGDFPKELATAVRATGAQLVVFGNTQPQRLGVSWHRGEMPAARKACPVPIVVLDADRPLDERLVERWRERLSEEAMAASDLDDLPREG